jgi:hypothetical protein
MSGDEAFCASALRFAILDRLLDRLDLEGIADGVADGQFGL